MTFDIEFGRRSRSISVKRGRADDQYSVTIDGRSLEIMARRSGDSALVISRAGVAQPATDADKTSVRNDFRTHAQICRLFLTPMGAAGEVLVILDGRTAAVRVNGRRGRSADTVAQRDGDQPVTAPMPGRVVRVLVAAGDEVAAGQGLVVVEAMKMENELRAPKTGKVKDVNVSAGTSVDAGKVLVVIE
jgi:biotin carboxyl carrier protein